MKEDEEEPSADDGPTPRLLVPISAADYPPSGLPGRRCDRHRLPDGRSVLEPTDTAEDRRVISSYADRSLHRIHEDGGTETPLVKSEAGLAS